MNRKTLVYVYIAAAVAILSLVAFWQVYSMRNAPVRDFYESLDEQVERLDSLETSARDVWKSFRDGEMRPRQAMEEIGKLHNEARGIAAGARNAYIHVDTPPGRRLELLGARRAAERAALTTSSFLFSSIISVQHRSFDMALTYEGELNEKNTAKLGEQAKELREEYLRRDWPAELETEEMQPAKDADYIFVILIDALRADHLSCLGYARPTSPSIDSIASRGLVFENAMSQSSHTDTSIATLLTACYPETHKMRKTTDWLWELSLVGRFADAGYATGGFSANALILKDYHFDNGFTHFEEYPFTPATVMIDRVTGWLDGVRGAEDKIFVYLHLIDPHDMYFAPYPFFDIFDRGKQLTVTAYLLGDIIERRLPGLGASDPECSFNPLLENWGRTDRVLDCARKIPEGRNIDRRGIDNMVARYDGEIRYADDAVGRLAGFLENRGMLDHSTFVILADHGESFLEHNQTRHGRVLYDNEIHVPFIFWNGAGRIPPGRVKEQVQTIHLMPTLMAMAGIDIPGGIHGHNLFPVPEDAAGGGDGLPAPVTDEKAYSYSYHGLNFETQEFQKLASVRERDFKYIKVMNRKTGDFHHDEFYHLASDPGEVHDSRDRYPEDFSRLKAGLERAIETTSTTPPRPVSPEADDSKLQRLKEMGYLR